MRRFSSVIRVSLAVVLGSAATALAHDRPSVATSFSELQRRVRIGETLFVTNDAGEVIKGTVTHVSDAVLLLRQKDTEHRFTSRDARRITRRGHAVRTGAMVGLLAGATTGALWAVQQPCDFTCFSSAGGVAAFGAIGAGVGLAGGALVGVALTGEEVLYERAMRDGYSPVATVMLPASAKGVLVQINW